MSVIAGLKAKNGYLFVTGNINGDSLNNGDILRLNINCGALLVTKQKEQLERVKKLLNRYLNETPEKADGLTVNLISNLTSFLKTEFKNNVSYKLMPLPFLLLVIGINRGHHAHLEHFFIRNRVTEVLEKSGQREFVTVFDINPVVPAGNIFYGNSNIIQYLAQQIPCLELSTDIVKLLACLSMSEFYNEEGSLSACVKMASLSAENGFNWIKTEELLLLTNKTREVNFMLADGLNSFLSRENLTKITSKR